jgi:uroporphyrin-III C-methyltransferase/precorrin-2 dehydrogenase/sirohydrochlorin ferrochelatase
MSETRVLLPLFLDLSGKDVLVVGAGVVATRKVADLVAVRAMVRVVAPRVTDELKAASAAGSITLHERGFEERDVDDAWLVLASTDDAAVQTRVAAACERARVFCVAVDDPPNASAYGGAIVRRGPVTIAISTSGEAPALARLLREVLEQALPDEGFVDAARALRERWKADKTPMASRFGELVQAFKERSAPKP